MKKALSLAWTGLANLASLAANLYLVAYLANLEVPGADVADASTGQAVLVNAGLVLLFGVQHSLMARNWFKERWTNVVPEHLERATYVLVASFTLGLVLWLWQPAGGVLWSLSAPPAVGTWVLFGLGLGIMGWATMAVDPEAFFGLRQVERHYSGEEDARYRDRVPMLVPRPTLASNGSSDELGSHQQRRSR